MTDIKMIEAEAKEYVIKTHDVCFENRIIPNYTEGQFHIDNERSYIAGRSKSMESEARKDERIKSLEQGIERFIDWVHLELKLEGYEHQQIIDKAKHLLKTKE